LLFLYEIFYNWSLFAFVWQHQAYWLSPSLFSGHASFFIFQLFQYQTHGDTVSDCGFYGLGNRSITKLTVLQHRKKFRDSKKCQVSKWNILVYNQPHCYEN